MDTRKQIVAQVHTVYLMVGLPNSGKSSFAEFLVNSFYDQVSGTHVVADIISEDRVLKQLLTEDPMQVIGINNFNAKKKELKPILENLMLANIEARISFPNLSEFVVVDGNGYDSAFRNRVEQLAVTKNYKFKMILFYYKKDEYPASPETDSFLYNTLPEIAINNKPDQMMIVSEKPIRGVPWETYFDVRVEDVSKYNDCLVHVPPMGRVIVVADIHEHLVPFKLLLEQGFGTGLGGRTRLVLVGDYLDKGQHTEETVRFVYDLVKNPEKYSLESVTVVSGNHEAFVARELREYLKSPERYKSPPQVVNFSSYSTLEQNEELRDLFFDLWDNHTVPFAKITLGQTGSPAAYVTHAPCDEIHLSKFSTNSIKPQRNVIAAQGRDQNNYDYRLGYSFIFEQARDTGPLHIFGHVSHASPSIRYKNKIFLDTGSVYGGGLSYVSISQLGHVIRTEPSEPLVKKTLHTDLTIPLFM